MELRQLEAFVAVATELHFGRAAQKLFIGQPTLSDLIRRLERELGTPLLIRTTRRVTLTEAGAELLGHAKRILTDVAAATAAVHRIAGSETGTVQVGMTPPVTPVLARHLGATFARAAPGIELSWSQLWLPNLIQAVADASVDVGITCGLIGERDGLASEVFCAEPLLVGLRPGHRLAGQERVRLADLARDRLGATAETLFPAWALAQRQALAAAGVDPPQAQLAMTDLAAVSWQDQPELDWIMLTGSLTSGHAGTVIRPVDPPYNVPFTLQWNPSRTRSPAVARFVQHALTTDPPAGWLTGPDHRGLAPEDPGRSLGRSNQIDVSCRSDRTAGEHPAGLLAPGRPPAALAAAQRTGAQRPAGPRAEGPDRRAAEPGLVSPRPAPGRRPGVDAAQQR
jgi:DNA-binding transcriptional LysR family regulator